MVKQVGALPKEALVVKDLFTAEEEVAEEGDVKEDRIVSPAEAVDEQDLDRHRNDPAIRGRRTRPFGVGGDRGVGMVGLPTEFRHSDAMAQ